jgi:hypothetical protein
MPVELRSRGFKRGTAGDAEAGESGDTSPLLQQQGAESFLKSPNAVADKRAGTAAPAAAATVDPEWLRRVEDSGERELPQCMRSAWCKSAFILLIVLVGER